MAGLGKVIHWLATSLCVLGLSPEISLNQMQLLTPKKYPWAHRLSVAHTLGKFLAPAY